MARQRICEVKNNKDMEQFEQQLNNDLHQYLLSLDEVDDRQPECPDVEEK